MSLLLDALKKASEANRRRLEAGVEGEKADAEALAAPPEPATRLAEPDALPELSFADEPPHDVEQIAPSAAPLQLAIEPANDAMLVSHPLSLSDHVLETPITTSNDTTQDAVAFMSAEPIQAPPVGAETPNVQAAPNPDTRPALATPAVTPIAEPRPVSKIPGPTIPALDPIKPAPRSDFAAANKLSPEATRQLFDSKHNAAAGKHTKRTKLVLLAGLILLAGLAIAAWLWWQWQASQTLIDQTPSAQGAPALVGTVAPTRPDVMAAEPALSPAPAALGSTASSIPVASAAARPVVISSPASIQRAAVASNLPNQPKPGDRAKVIEMPARTFAPDVRFVRDEAPTAIPKNISLAYQSFQQADYNRAAELYRQQLAIDSKNRDALLGLAAVASKKRQIEEARALYRRILADNPGDEVATGALLSLASEDESENTESRLKTLVENRPSAEASTSLANVLAKQGRWREAQDYYFKAHSMVPTEPDYAYNLAIALEALGERKLATDFYGKALTLMQSKSASFDADVVRKRLNALGAN